MSEPKSAQEIVAELQARDHLERVFRDLVAVEAPRLPFDLVKDLDETVRRETVKKLVSMAIERSKIHGPSQINSVKGAVQAVLRDTVVQVRSERARAKHWAESHRP